MKIILIIIFCFSIYLNPSLGQKPVRIWIVGLSHSHVLSLLRNLSRKDIQIVGIAESNRDLSNRYQTY